MIIDDQHYDLIIVGTGAGGGTLAQKLAPTGKKILILERGDFLPKEKENWSADEVFSKERYHQRENWFDNASEPFRPQINYWVGGNTKVYGAALLRMREQDFEAVKHQEGVSTEWHLKYQDFEPYYTEAEKLYNVHGKQGEDPTEPSRTEEYPHPPVSHEPQMQQICDAISKQGLHPFHLPLGINMNEEESNESDCFRCKTCDGFPCKVDAKADAEVKGVMPALKYPNVTLKTQAKVVCLHTSPSGREVKSVEAQINGQSYLFFGDIVVLACGAVNSAALLLRSPNEKHPNGLANSSDQVGRNFMKYQITAIIQLAAKTNTVVFPKTICVHDFYWGDADFPYPMGHIQNIGSIHPEMITAEAPPLLAVLARLVPESGLRQLAGRAIGWWLQTEDLPDPNNRVRVVGNKLHLDYTHNNIEAHDRLIYHWTEVLKQLDTGKNSLFSQSIFSRSDTPIKVLANQCGTCRFGEDPQTSVLDLNCRTHDVDNLYVVDGSFFPSSAGVSPALTIMANALRVGEHLIERLNGV
ncbi:GMC oxidoreductase [Iningainema tapete]|uniref:GMC family oxidoreductase n=1 Tax=Iningainema tapete BLCC-T55 TaxID=2748662 RepID=A0A8J6XG01_9CYAN|nr:GMC family oxidoreductase [Iningainema tapete]MBD2770914.1 GMC family oxidoreductase [Iningainema tapete BLCC-T55]